MQPFSIFEPFAERFDLQFFTKEDHVRTDEDIAKRLESNHIASLWQSHGNRTIIARAPTSRTEKADAIATDRTGLWLEIRAADCQQLIVYAPKAHVAAVIHAGWKGLKAQMIQSLFQTLKEEWDIDPADTYVGIGPSLCMQCAEFSDPVTELEGLDPQFFHGRHADLQGIADAQLDEVGVPRTQRERSPDCTKCRSDRYWSYRGGNQGEVKEGYTNVMVAALRDVRIAN